MCQHKTTIIILMSINETRILCQDCGKYRDAGKREHVWINLIESEGEEKHINRCEGRTVSCGDF